MRLHSLAVKFTFLIGLVTPQLAHCVAANAASSICSSRMADLLATRESAGSLEILTMPQSLDTYATLRPGDIATQYYDKLEVRSADETLYNFLFDLLKQGEPQPPKMRGVDVRFGLIVKAKDGSELGSLYLTRVGAEALINGENCWLAGPVIERLSRTLGILGAW